jgi:D-alanyl-D-alanine carboxypeptidase
VASLLGRILRGIYVFLALWAVTLAQPAQSAPFAAIVMDARSGEVLYEKNADTRLHPASLTKMMTLYIVFQEIEAGRLHLDDKVTVSKNAAAQPPSRLGLKAGQKIAVRYLIRAAAVKSANDAASALGDHIGGTTEAFAKRMTKTARALGMKNSTFRNANGLTADGHLSTARDMNILGRHLFYDFPQYYNIFSRRTADAGIAEVRNTNSRFLDGYEGADGIKTGYTVAAGFNLTASAQRGKKRIIATVFGGTSTAARNAKMAELMDLGFGAARNNVREKVPAPAPVPEEMLVAEAPPQIDEPDVEGGAAKTIRVSGEMTRSLRPKLRPGETVALAAAVPAEAPVVPDAVAVAIAESVEGALGEALAAPAPEGTLEAQVEQLAAAEAAEAVTEPVEPLADALALAAPEGTLEAQAVALADGTAPAADTPAVDAAPEGTLDAQAVALADSTSADTAEADPALAALRPVARPEPLAAETTEDTAVAAVEAPAAPVEEVVAPAEQPAEAVLVAEAPAEPATEPAAEDPVLLADATDTPADSPALTEVETVAAAVMAPSAPTAPARKAPIFESVEPAPELAAAEPEPAQDEVVLVKSTSGRHHWGVNVGDFTSHAEAERALLKTALAESATLNQGKRKITQSGGSYHANFMGLTEEQADLACRRLRARGVACETLGPA